MSMDRADFLKLVVRRNASILPESLENTMNDNFLNADRVERLPVHSKKRFVSLLMFLALSAGLYGFGSIRSASEVRNSSTHGVLKLTLNATSYSWQFVPVAGKSFTDRGTTNCR